MDNQAIHRLDEIIQLLRAYNFYNKDILSLKEACHFLDISPSFLYKLTAERKISFYVPNGKKIYFKKVELEKWLTDHRINSESEIQAEEYKNLK